MNGRRVLVAFLVFFLTLSPFLNLTEFVHAAPGRRIGWNSRTEYVVQNSNGSYTSTFYLGPQVFYNATTDTYRDLQFIMNPSGMSQQGVRFFLQNSQIAIELTDQAATFFNPDYTQLCVASEMWTVEYLQAQWRDTGIGTAAPTWTYQNDSQSVNVTRTQTISGAGQLNITYSLRVGQFLKHIVSYRADVARSNYRVAMHLDGIISNRVKTNSGNIYNVNSETHTYPNSFVVGSDDQNLVYQENLESVFNQTNTATTGNLTDVVFNTGSGGMKADLYIGTWDLPVNGILGFDPATSTYSYSTPTSWGQYAAAATYSTARDSSTGTYQGINPSATASLGQEYTTTYSVNRQQYRFDTISLVGSTISSAKLCLNITFDGSTSYDFIIKVQGWTDASDGLATDDYSAFFFGVNYDDGTATTNGLTLNAYLNVTLTNTTELNDGGFCDLFLRSNRDVGANAPTGSEVIQINQLYTILVVTFTQDLEYDYVDNNTCNVDSSVNKGTQSNFTAQRFPPDLINDTLTEANTAGTTTSSVFTDGFEAGNFDLWDQNGATTWTADGGILTAATGNLEGWASTPHSGTYHAGTGATGDGELETDNMDLSSIVNFGISFWYAVDDTDGASELVLNYWDGAAYDTIQDLSGGTEDSWTYYSAIVTDSQYFDATFRVQFIAACGSNEAVYIDDFAINKTVNNPANYRLDIEEQWTNVNYTRANEELCIYMGPYGNGETIYAQYWGGASWTNLTTSLTANSWNNITVSLTSETFTIRFLDGTQSSDAAQSTWQIDACLLHTWETAGNASSFTLSATVTTTSSSVKSFTMTKKLTQTVTATGTLASTKTMTKGLAEAMDATSSLGSVRGVVITLAQTIAATDSATFQKTLIRILSQTITSTSNMESQKALARLFAETLAASTNAQSIRGVIVVLAQTITATGNLETQKTLARVLTQTIVATGNLQTQKTLTQLLTETLLATADLKAVRGVLFTLIESASVSSNLSTQKALVRLLSQTVTSTSTLTTQKTLTRLLSESASASSNLNAVRGVIFRLLESLGITDSEATQKAITKALSETASSTSSLAVNKALIRLLVELLSASDDFDYSIDISVEALEVLLTGTTSASSNLETQKALTKLLSTTTTSTSSLDPLKALTRILTATAIATSSLDYSIAIGAKFLEFALSGIGTATSSLETQKTLTKILAQTILPASSLSVQKSIFQNIVEVLTGTLTATSTLSTQKNLYRIFDGTITAITDFETSLGIHAFFVEYVNSVRITGLLKWPFPVELMSVDEAIAMAVVACMISGAVVGTMFMARRKRNDD